MSVFHSQTGKSILLGASCLAIGAAVAAGIRPASAGDDHADSPAGATPLPLGITMGGTIGVPSDQDWFVVQPTPPAAFVVSATAGDRSIPRVTVVDGDLRTVGSGPAGGSVRLGATFSIAVPAGVRPPVRVRVTQFTGIGAYTLSASVAGGPDAPPAPAAPPPTPPPPPPPPPPPVDDVGDGTPHVLTVAAPFDGRLGTSGDVDVFTFTAPVDGDYTFSLTSPDGSLTDAVADAVPGQQNFLATWVEQPGVLTMVADQPVTLTVRSLGENVGSYRISVTAPAGSGLTPPPPPPPPAAPVFEGLAVDPSQDMLARASRDYVSYVYGKFRVRDTMSANAELEAALAIRGRWIARDRGQRLGVARADSAGAIDAAVSRFGNVASAPRNFSAYSNTLRSAATPGGGSDAASVVALVQAAVAAKRPLLLAGVRNDQLMEVWVVYGLETATDGSVSLRALDPSSPGGSVLLPVAPHGLAPVGSGAGLVLRYAFAGGDKDLLP
jgi:hypothetical protein